MEFLSDPGLWLVAGVFIIIFWFIRAKKKKSTTTTGSVKNTPPVDPTTGKIDPEELERRRDKRFGRNKP